jgi:hypothetical protein
VDLIYCTNLPDFLRCYTLTPQDSPNRLVLQENYGAAEGKETDGESLAHLLRDLEFQKVAELARFFAFHTLSLSDVVAIRGSPEWLHYIAAVRRVVENPSLFDSSVSFSDADHGATALVQAYYALLQKIAERYARSETTRLKPIVQIVFDFGAHAVMVAWLPEHVASNTFFIDKAKDLGSQVAVTIVMGWVQSGVSMIAENAVKIEIGRRRVHNAKAEHIALLASLKSMGIHEASADVDETETTTLSTASET